MLCHLFCSILPTFRGGLTKKGPRQLFSLWPFLFSHSEPPLTENPLWGNIEPFPVILSPCPYTVLPANIIYQHSFFSKSQIFPPISWHRCNIPCWELDSTSHIIRFSFHSDTGPLSSSSGVWCFLSNVARHRNRRWDTTEWTSPLHFYKLNKAVILAKLYESRFLPNANQQSENTGISVIIMALTQTNQIQSAKQCGYSPYDIKTNLML